MQKVFLMQKAYVDLDDYKVDIEYQITKTIFNILEK